jgi:Spy/CpxP family protein refolding chaperone
MKLFMTALLFAALGCGFSATAEEAAAAPAAAEPPAAESNSAPAEQGPFKNVTREQWLAIASSRMAESAETLKLTEEQREALRPIVLEQLDQIRAITETMDPEESSWQRMSKMRALRAARDEGERKVDALLTPEQQALAAALRAERREKMQDAVARWRGGEEYALRDFLFPELAAPAQAPAE